MFWYRADAEPVWLKRFPFKVLPRCWHGGTEIVTLVVITWPLLWKGHSRENCPVTAANFPLQVSQQQTRLTAQTQLTENQHWVSSDTFKIQHYQCFIIVLLRRRKESEMLNCLHPWIKALAYKKSFKLFIVYVAEVVKSCHLWLYIKATNMLELLFRLFQGACPFML